MSGIGDLSTVFGATGAPVKAESYPGVLAKGDSDSGKISDSSLTSGDRTEVSTMADGLSQALGTSDARMDKVNQLQAAIASGTYNVSSADVADKLMQSMMGDS